MAAPSSYTEITLGQYMHGVLGPVAAALDYTEPSADAGDYQNAVDEALLNYGADAIADVSGRENIRKLRALARVQVWRQVIAAVTGDFDFSADGGRYDRSQVHEMALKSLAIAEQEAMELGALPGYVVGVDAVQHIHDPYRYVPDEERVIP